MAATCLPLHAAAQTDARVPRCASGNSRECWTPAPASSSLIWRIYPARPRHPDHEGVSLPILGRDSMLSHEFSRWFLFLLLASELRLLGAADLTVNLRSRVEAFKGSGDWRAVTLQESISVDKTAVIICDMWDKHWCSGATKRVNALVEKMWRRFWNQLAGEVSRSFMRHPKP
ncbi:MAG: isochorismatase hydrolase [Candidatus Solibacter sp.]|jgi:hypothetical protein|nr:isochorismatase hydrolase [Candidatus Solibacter sp.]